MDDLFLPLTGLPNLAVEFNYIAAPSKMWHTFLMVLFKSFYRLFTVLLITAFMSASVYIPDACAGEIVLPPMPAPGTMVSLSSAYDPAYLKGIVIHPENALKFDFLVYRGNGNLTTQQKQTEYNKLIKYFLASLAVPDKDQWVNLSPYEKNRIIEEDFGETVMGRDLLAQDYLLKQITSSLIYPEKGLGKKFWDEVYAKAYKEYGNTNIPVNTFNKVWIVPDKAMIYEKDNTAYVVESRLKVMLDEDYVSLQKHAPSTTHTVASKVIRQVVLPAIEKEVNEGKNFAPLRQVYSSMLLAAWYKRALKESLLGRVYADKSKVKGVDQDPRANQAIYEQYLQAFKKGVFNYIKEENDPYTQQVIPRKYFSGGTIGWGDKFDHAQVVHELKPDQAQTALAVVSTLDAVSTDLQQTKVSALDATKERSRDQAMNGLEISSFDEFLEAKGIFDAFFQKITTQQSTLNGAELYLKRVLTSEFYTKNMLEPSTGLEFAYYLKLGGGAPILGSQVRDPKYQVLYDEDHGVYRINETTIRLKIPGSEYLIERKSDADVDVRRIDVPDDNSDTSRMDTYSLLTGDQIRKRISSLPENVRSKFNFQQPDPWPDGQFSGEHIASHAEFHFEGTASFGPDPQEKYLYVTDHTYGVSRIDLQTGKVERGLREIQIPADMKIKFGLDPNRSRQVRAETNAQALDELDFEHLDDGLRYREDTIVQLNRKGEIAGLYLQKEIDRPLTDIRGIQVVEQHGSDWLKIVYADGSFEFRGMGNASFMGTPEKIPANEIPAHVTREQLLDEGATELGDLTGLFELKHRQRGDRVLVLIRNGVVIWLGEESEAFTQKYNAADTHIAGWDEDIGLVFQEGPLIYGVGKSRVVTLRLDTDQELNVPLTKAQSQVEAPNADGFVVGGVNTNETIAQLTQLNGRTIAQIESDSRPGVDAQIAALNGRYIRSTALSDAGFLGSTERLKDVLLADNTFVTSQGLNHQQLVEPLFYAMNFLESTGSQSGRFRYKGNLYEASYQQWRGIVESPFHDGLRPSRDYTVTNLETGASLGFSQAVPYFIQRYGFYEGNTPYRVDPKRILEVFFTKQDDEILQARRGERKTLSTPEEITRLAGLPEETVEAILPNIEIKVRTLQELNTFQYTLKAHRRLVSDIRNRTEIVINPFSLKPSKSDLLNFGSIWKAADEDTRTLLGHALTAIEGTGANTWDVFYLLSNVKFDERIASKLQIQSAAEAKGLLLDLAFATGSTYKTGELTSEEEKKAKVIRAAVRKLNEGKELSETTFRLVQSPDDVRRAEAVFRAFNNGPQILPIGGAYSSESRAYGILHRNGISYDTRTYALKYSYAGLDPQQRVLIGIVDNVFFSLGPDRTLEIVKVKNLEDVKFVDSAMTVGDSLRNFLKVMGVVSSIFMPSAEITAKQLNGSIIIVPIEPQSPAPEREPGIGETGTERILREMLERDRIGPGPHLMGPGDKFEIPNAPAGSDKNEPHLLGPDDNLDNLPENSIIKKIPKPQPSSDKISMAKPGGIDFNSSNLNLQIRRDGKGVPLPLAQQDMAQLSRIQGFVPRIIKIRPAAVLPIFSELKQKLRVQPAVIASAS